MPGEFDMAALDAVIGGEVPPQQDLGDETDAVEPEVEDEEEEDEDEESEESEDEDEDDDEAESEEDGEPENQGPSWVDIPLAERRAFIESQASELGLVVQAATQDEVDEEDDEYAGVPEELHGDPYAVGIYKSALAAAESQLGGKIAALEAEILRPRIEERILDLHGERLGEHKDAFVKLMKETSAAELAQFIDPANKELAETILDAFYGRQEREARSAGKTPQRGAGRQETLPQPKTQGAFGGKPRQTEGTKLTERQSADFQQYLKMVYPYGVPPNVDVSALKKEFVKK